MANEVLIQIRAEDSASAVLQKLRQEVEGLRSSMGTGQSGTTSYQSVLVSLAATFYDVQTAAYLLKSAVSTVWDNSVAPAAAYEVELQRIQANTGLTDQATTAMSATILQMAQTTSASIDGLAQGYFRLTNEGFAAADATKILNASQQLAVATGADVAKTTNLIGIVMHDYGINADQAANVTGAFLRAAHLGNTTMEEFANGLRKPLPGSKNVRVYRTTY